MARMPAGIRRLSLPVPKIFERVADYSGNRRWVAFYWSKFSEAPAFDDGYDFGTAGSARAWHFFMRHRLVKECLKDIDLGSTRGAATHLLLLDRQQRRFYIGEQKTVWRFLRIFKSQFEKPLPDYISIHTMGWVKRTYVISKPVLTCHRAITAAEAALLKELALWLDEAYARLKG